MDVRNFKENAEVSDNVPPIIWRLWALELCS